MTVDGWVDPPSWVHRASSWFRWGILVLGSDTLGLADPLLLVEVAWVSEGIPPLSMEPHNCQHHSIAGHTSRKVWSTRRPFWKRQSDPAMLFEGSGDASPLRHIWGIGECPAPPVFMTWEHRRYSRPQTSPLNDFLASCCLWRQVTQEVGLHNAGPGPSSGSMRWWATCLV